jgi:hypothetical protein
MNTSSPQPRRALRAISPKFVIALCLLLAGVFAAVQAQPAKSAGSLSVTITSAPSGQTTDTTAKIYFTTNRARKVQCSLDGGSFNGCSSPVKYTGLAVGGHTFVVQAIRNSSVVSATASWEVVAGAPAPTPPPSTSFTVTSSITSGSIISGSLVWTATASISVSKVQFYVDGALRWTENYAPYQFNGDPGGKLDTTVLLDGSHTLKVVGTAGDGSTAETTVTVQVLNTTAPPPAPASPPPPTTTTPTGGAGDVVFMEKTNPGTDKYTNSPTTTQQQWLRDKWQRAITYTSYFDSKTSWFPNAWVYLDAYAIYNPSDLANQHPDWILKDSSGNKLFIPYGCYGGTCPQYAADIGSSAWRQYFISKVQSLIAKGYKGVFVDDVDMDINVGNGNGQDVAPVDPRTGQLMTDTVWKSYFADFMEQLRAALPGVEIVHNAVWFAGGGLHDASNPYIAREMKAADYIDIERGLNDGGLTGGTGTWSVYALMRYVDRVHSYGAHVLYQSYATDVASAEYNLAGYLLTNDGGDMVSTTGLGLPDSWWSGYDTNIGDALGARYLWNGVWRRDFTGGFVLLNEPGSTTKTFDLGGTFKNTSGQSVTSVTLGAARGAVFAK